MGFISFLIYKLLSFFLLVFCSSCCFLIFIILFEIYCNFHCFLNESQKLKIFIFCFFNLMIFGINKDEKDYTKNAKILFYFLIFFIFLYEVFFEKMKLKEVIEHVNFYYLYNGTAGNTLMELMKKMRF